MLRMKATPLAIPEVVLIESSVFGDKRGFLFDVAVSTSSIPKASAPSEENVFA